MTLGLRYSPVGVVARALTHGRPPEWVSAKPKRFAWTIGLAMSLSMTVVINSGVRGLLPRTVCLVCLTLMWLESVLGLCIGCEIARLLMRRGWMRDGPGFEICAGGRCNCRGGADVQILTSEAAFLDELRATEYARLDARGEVYLDYCGGSLYATSQVEEHQRLLRETVFGNPHSANPTSSAATALVEAARAAVLRYFRAAESEYDCIFTANATGALRLVGEAYPFGRRAGSWRPPTTTTR